MKWARLAGGAIYISILLSGCGASGDTQNRILAPTPNQVVAQVNNTQSSNPPDMQSSLNSEQSVLTQIGMISPQNGAMAGYYDGVFCIWRTTDGGAHWTIHHLPIGKAGSIRNSVSEQTPQVFFQSEDSDWVAWISVGNNGSQLNVLHTADGARTWTRHVENVVPVAGYVKQITFSSNLDGWIRAFSGGLMNQGDTTIFRTTDGGQVWKMVSSATGYVGNQHATAHALPEVDVPMPMTFVDNKSGWISVGNFVQTETTRTTLYHTADGGQTWYPLSLHVPKAYREHNFYATTLEQPIFSGNIGTVVVQYQGDYDYVVGYHTINGGESWSIGTPTRFLPQDYALLQSSLGPQSVWLMGKTGRTFERSDNGGQSWVAIPISGVALNLFHAGYSVRQLDMVTAKAGWIIVEYVNSISGEQTTRLLKTVDGGRNWTVTSGY